MAEKKLDSIKLNILREVADLEGVPQGAYSLRVDGETFRKNSSENIVIEKKTDKPGIDIYIKAGTKRESVHIPVLLSQTGLKELVYNDFHIGEDCDVTIVAGCGIHNGGSEASEHSGVHSFFVSKNARVKYVEKHYGEGDGNGRNLMNPTSCIEMDEKFPMFGIAKHKGYGTKEHMEALRKYGAEPTIYRTKFIRFLDK